MTHACREKVTQLGILKCSYHFEIQFGSFDGFFELLVDRGS